ncbi:MAG: response regulator [Deltaproteobacteria bacterium]|nr:response regulator [Deltaproteobacteria bacterium]
MNPPDATSVLLVDDEPIILATVEAALSRAGYQVTALGNGADASAHLAEHRPDVVVTDVAMEGMSGIDLLRRAKALDPDVAVIVVTGYCDAGTAIESLRLGAEDYLAKPFDFDELLLRVARCAETRALRLRVRRCEEHLSDAP